MGIRVLLWRLTALFSVLVVAGCGVVTPFGRDNYPLPNDPPNTHQYNPADVGKAVQAVVLFIEPRPNDRIEFLSAVGVGTTSGADVVFYLSRPVVKPNGDHVIGEQLEPLEGSVVTNESGTSGPNADVGIVAEVTPRESGQFEIFAVHLSYRLNDGIAEQGTGISTTFTVCADGTSCDPPR